MSIKNEFRKYKIEIDSRGHMRVYFFNFELDSYILIVKDHIDHNHPIKTVLNERD